MSTRPSEPARNQATDQAEPSTHGEAGRQGDEQREQVESPGEHLHGGHGNSIAAWTAVGIIMLGALISSIAVGIAVPWLFFAGLVVCALGVVAGKVLQIMGFGQEKYDEVVPGPDRGVR